MEKRAKNNSCGIRLPLTDYRDKWRLIETAERPTLLYHYTNLAGLVGITNTKQLWMSKSSYLNDYSEVNFFLEKLYLTIDSLLSFGVDQESLFKVKTLIQRMKKDFYICSFCEDGDLLSQWRAYTNSGVGVSLGMSVAFLSEMGNSAGLHMIKCVYCRDTQNEIATSLILDAIEKLETNFSSDLSWIERNICLAALSCKDPSFSEEREWRLVLIDGCAQKSFFSVRASASRLIPYYKLSFPAWSSRGLIDDCYIGPTADFHDIEEGLRLLITENICDQFSIRQSRIPFR